MLNIIFKEMFKSFQFVVSVLLFKHVKVVFFFSGNKHEFKIDFCTNIETEFNFSADIIQTNNKNLNFTC